MNLPASRESTGQPAPLQLGIVSATALSARLDDRAAQRSFAVGPFDLAVDTAAASSRPGAFGPGEFTARAGQTELSGTIAGRLGFDGSRVRIEDLTVETIEVRAVVGGWADVIGEQPAMSVHASATVDLVRAPRLAAIAARGLTGHLDATIDAAGALTAPTLALSLTGRDISHAQLGPVRLAGRSSLTGTRALIDTLDVDAAVGSLHADGAIELGETPPRAAAPASHVALRWSNLRLDDLVHAFGEPLPVRTGSLAHGTATVDFDLPDLQARAWSRVRAAATTTLEPATSESSRESLSLSGRAELLLDRGGWSLRHTIDARNAQADIVGTLSGRLLDSAGDLRSTLGGSSRLGVADVGALPPLMQAAGVKLPPDAIEDLAGSIRTTFQLAGTLETPRAQVDLEARNLRSRVWPDTADLDARLALDTNAVHAQSVRATAGTTSLQASGRYSWRGPFDARVRLQQGDLSQLASQFRVPVTVAGSAQLEGTISGTLSSVARRGEGVLTLSARDFAVDEIAIGALDARGALALEDGGLTTIDATAPAVGARARVEIVNRAGYPVSGELTIDHDDIGTLVPPRYHQQIGELSGRLHVTARGSGRLADPAAIRGRVDLRELDLLARGTRVALAAPGSVTLAEDRIAVDGVDLRIGQHTRATLGGQLGVTALTDALRLHLEGPLAELIDIGARSGGAEPLPVRGDGTATLDLAIRGTLARPQPDGSVVVRSPSLAYGTLPPATALALDATIEPTLITLRTFEAQWQGASLNAGGTVPWRVVLSSVQTPPEPGSPPSSVAEWVNALPAEPALARLTIRVRNVTEAVVKDFVTPEQFENIQGGGSATVVVEADRLSLERVQATAVLDGAWLTLAGVPFVEDVPTRLRLENGEARIDDFRWSADGNSIVVTGGAGLAQSLPSIELGVTGVLDLRVLSAFVTGVGAGGTARANLTASGPFDNPEIVGDLMVADGVLQLDSPRLAASDLAGTLRIAAGRKVAVSLAGLVNTGSAKVEGTLDLADLGAPLGALQLTARGVALDYPPGLQTESNADIELALGAASSTLNGRIDVLGGTYREALVLSSQLLRLSSTSGIARTAPPPDWLSRLRLDVAVATASDLRIDNNYGRLDVGLAVRLVGTAANPGVLGQARAAEDGEIYLGGNTYRIERLVIDLNNPRVITPEVNFSAQTRIGDLSIGIEFRCPATGPCERKVTSLTTGEDDQVAEARLFGTEGGAASAGEGLARLLSGEVLGVVGRTVGLDAIRLEQQAQSGDIFDDPTLISGDVDPAARLTLAKRLGSNVELVFSQNLADDGFTWITSYLGPHGLSWRLLILDDQSRSYEFRHEPPIGADRARRRPRPQGPRIAAVRIAGTPGFPEPEVRRQLRLTEGDRFTFAEWQRDRDRLERFYHAQGLVEARIRARRLPAAEGAEGAAAQPTGSPSDEQVVLEYTITRGPATQLIIRGATLPDAVRDRIVERWTSALFDGFLERDARTIVRDHLFREGYLDARITAAVAVDAARETKALTIDVVPGSTVPSAIEVTGNSALPTAQVLDVVRTPDPLAAWLDPPSVERLLEDHYRAEGFLAADVSIGRPESRNGTSVVTIQVVEGAPYSIGEVGVRGLPDEPGWTARETLSLASGDRYRPASVAENVDRLEAGLRRAAYREARIDVATRVDAKAARVDVAMVATPGPRSILHDVVVQGGDASEPSVARSIVLTPDAPLDPEAIGETRKRLYDLDVYRSVDIDVQPLATAAPPPSTGAPVDQPVVATITLAERPRYRIRYGLALNDDVVGADERERELGVAADLENRNVFGRNMSAGLSLRLRRDQQVGRVTLGASRLFGLPIRSTVFVEREREQTNPEGASPFTSDVNSLTAEQAYRVGRAVEMRYGYGIERNHTFIRTERPDDAFDLTVKIARLTTSGLVDRRDDPFNPRRGWFAASTLELSTPGLGSDLRFLKDFAQYLALRAGGTRARGRVGGAPRSRADVRGRGAHPERTLLWRRSEQRARVSRRRSGGPQHF